MITKKLHFYFFHTHSAQYKGGYAGKGIQFVWLVDIDRVTVLNADAATVFDICKTFGVDTGLGDDAGICFFDYRFINSPGDIAFVDSLFDQVNKHAGSRCFVPVALNFRFIDHLAPHPCLLILTVS